MQLLKPREVVNLDNFLPLDGEDRFEMMYTGNTLAIDIFYEKDDSASHEARLRICFLQAKYFFKTPFPGYSFFTCPDHSDMPLLNSLVEYGHSDLLDIEQKGSVLNGYKHYRLFLHSVGVAVHVIAKSFEMPTNY